MAEGMTRDTAPAFQRDRNGGHPPVAGGVFGIAAETAESAAQDDSGICTIMMGLHE